MISANFISEQIKKSKSERRTSSFIRNFVFYIVDKALKEQYGENYSVRCLQSSAGIQRMLQKFDIESKLYTSSFCTIEILIEGDKTEWAWGGFWDKDHHVIAVSEYSDLIDLSISQLYQHPGSGIKNAIPIPALWWTPLNNWPMHIKYLPESPVAIELPPEEMNKFNNYLNRVDEIADEALQKINSEDVNFTPMITGIDSLNKMTEDGNLWLILCRRIVEQGIKYPEWIINKEIELRKNIAENRDAQQKRK
jgi:hypothetical protein